MVGVSSIGLRKLTCQLGTPHVDRSKNSPDLGHLHKYCLPESTRFSRVQPVMRCFSDTKRLIDQLDQTDAQQIKAPQLLETLRDVQRKPALADIDKVLSSQRPRTSRFSYNPPLRHYK
jgi:hypothetical protein